MRIDEARRQRHVAQVDHVGARWQANGFAEACDFVAFHYNVRIAQQSVRPPSKMRAALMTIVT